MAYDKIILASASPRRKIIFKKILLELGFAAEFEVIPPDCEEEFSERDNIDAMTERNARKKAICVAHDHPNSFLIAADTLVHCDGRALCKPTDMKDAFAMLSGLSGKKHEVVTAVALYLAGRKIGEQGVSSYIERTRVIFKEISPERIRAYHARVNPLDKSGSYDAMNDSEMIIERIVGDPDNVGGLPYFSLLAKLKSLLN